jgi:hypothetical protein
MHDWDIELCLETFFDFEATWSSDIFEVNSPETISNQFYRFYEFVDILRSDDDRECIHSGKFLEKYTLPFHNWAERLYDRGFRVRG